jgi:hypothetical protein
MTPLTKVGKRLDNITRYILDKYPQDKWVLSNIVPMFLEVIKSSISVKEKQLIVTQLNKLIDSYEFRYNQTFEILQKSIREVLNSINEKEDRCKRIADRKYDKPSAYKSGAIVRCRKGNIWKDLKEEKETLRTWFKRKGAPGKEGGWVDCNAPIRKDGKITGYKTCGRKEGEKRAKYPSCRPTPAQCKSPGKGTKWGKTK